MRELPGTQQSDRWIKNRVGRITASRLGDVMSILTRKSKSGEAGEAGAKRMAYRRELIAERILGRAADHFVTRYMEEGSQRESEARAMYEMATHQMVIPANFVLHPEFDFFGASPDGLVGDDGLLEIKSPKPETLLEWIETGQIPDEYIKQCQGEMVCCDRQWADFYGWYPGLPHFFARITRDNELIAQMEAEVEKLHLEVESFLARSGYPPTVWNTTMTSGRELSDETYYLPPYDDSKSFADNCAFIGEGIIP